MTKKIMVQAMHWAHVLMLLAVASSIMLQTPSCAPVP